MIQIKTKGYLRKSRNGTGYKGKSSMCYKQFTQEELQTLTPTEKEYITKAARAYHAWESLDEHIKSEQKRLLALLRDWGKKQDAYRKYLWKVQSPACDELSAQMCVIQYRDYMRKECTDDDIPTDEIPF